MTEGNLKSLIRAKYYLAGQHTEMGGKHSKIGWAKCTCQTAKAIRLLDTHVQPEMQFPATRRSTEAVAKD